MFSRCGAGWLAGSLAGYRAQLVGRNHFFAFHAVRRDERGFNGDDCTTTLEACLHGYLHEVVQCNETRVLQQQQQPKYSSPSSVFLSFFQWYEWLDRHRSLLRYRPPPDSEEHAQACLNVYIVRSLSLCKRAQVPLLGIKECSERNRQTARSLARPPARPPACPSACQTGADDTVGPSD